VPRRHRHHPSLSPITTTIFIAAIFIAAAIFKRLR
jgi:hypothetical protein